MDGLRSAVRIHAGFGVDSEGPVPATGRGSGAESVQDDAQFMRGGGCI